MYNLYNIIILEETVIYKCYVMNDISYIAPQQNQKTYWWKATEMRMASWLGITLPCNFPFCL